MFHQIVILFLLRYIIINKPFIVKLLHDLFKKLFQFECLDRSWRSKRDASYFFSQGESMLQTWYFGAIFYCITWIFKVVVVLEGCIAAFDRRGDPIRQWSFQTLNLLNTKKSIDFLLLRCQMELNEMIHRIHVFIFIALFL